MRACDSSVFGGLCSLVEVLSMATLLGNPVFTSRASSRPAISEPTNTSKSTNRSTTSDQPERQSIARNTGRSSSTTTAINGSQTASDKTSATTDAINNTIGSHTGPTIHSPTSSVPPSQRSHNDSTSSGLSSVNQNAAIAISAIGKSTALFTLHALH